MVIEVANQMTFFERILRTTFSFPQVSLSQTTLKPIRLKTRYIPAIANIVLSFQRRAIQDLIPHLSRLLPLPLQIRGDSVRGRLSFEIGTLQETVIFGGVGLAGEEEMAEVGAEVLVLLQCCAGGPIGVGAVCPDDILRKWIDNWEGGWN
jgi:hypothetical protein